MKTTIILLFAVQVCIGQIVDELPSEEGLVNFNEIVKLDSVDKTEIYLRAKSFFISNFNSAKDVIQMDDKEECIIVGRGWRDIVIPMGLTNVPVQMWYKVRIQGKDGRYRYEIFDIQFTSYASQYAPSTTTAAEEVFDIKNYYNKSGKPRNVPEKYKHQTLRACLELGQSIKLAMQTTSKPKKDW